MKAVLVLCLLAFISSQKDIADIGKCIYKAPKVKELIADAMIAIATKDFSKLWPKIKEALPELIKIVIGCVTEDKVAEEEPKLEGWYPTINCTKQYLLQCQSSCRKAELLKISTYEECYKKCISVCIKKNN